MILILLKIHLIKTENQNTLQGAELILNNEKYNLTTGFISLENLQLRNNDRYQYVLPYYNFDRSIFKILITDLEFSIKWSNELIGIIKVKIVNNLFSSLVIFQIMVLKAILILI